MLSALQQGSLIHIIDKTKELKYKVGEVVSKTEPQLEFNAVNNGMQLMYFDINVKVDNENYDFKHIPTNVSIAYYNNSSIIISETKEALIPTVETILHNSEQIVDENNIKFHKDNITNCKETLKVLNPSFAKEEERENRINSLETQMRGMDDKLDRIFNLINNK